jgi:hypothetical protein
MDDADRTRTEPFDVPPEMIVALRRAADFGLELASDNGGDWNNSVRAEVLTAARTYDLFHYGSPSQGRVARCPAASHR